MAKSKKGSKGKHGADGSPAPSVLARRRRNKASSIRVRQKAGESISDDDLSFLVTYDAEPHGNSDAATEAAAVAAGDDPTDGAGGGVPAGVDGGGAGIGAAPDAPAAAAGAAPPPGAPPPPRYTPPPPGPPPPRVAWDDVKSSGKRTSGGKWQDKYSILGDEETPEREATCTYLASVWVGVLETFATQLTEVGVAPLIDPKQLTGAIVLTVDQLLPPEVALTPELVAAAGTTALLAQRVLNAKKIKAAQDEKASRERFRSAKSAIRVEPDAPPPPPVHPEPTVHEGPPPGAVLALVRHEHHEPEKAPAYDHRPSDLG